MHIGLPKEIKKQEHRVAMTPAVVASLVHSGHQVNVERGAGLGAGYSDEEYSFAGASMLDRPDLLFAASELIVKVKEPQPDEVAMLNDSHTLLTYLHLAADKQLTQSLTASGCTGLAYETLAVGERLPLLEPMSEIAGSMAPIAGAYHLAKHTGGRGTLLSSVPGVGPSKAVVLGGGTAGMHAARVAAGMGADVTILELDFERMRMLEMNFPQIHTMYSSEANLRELLRSVDLLVGAVLLPGAAAPKLVTREMLGLMPEGSVIVDIAVDQGGCVESTRATTHAAPTFTESGVLHYCVANMPAAYARTATIALSNVTAAWIGRIAGLGLESALSQFAELASAVNCTQGMLTNEAVAQSHDLPWTPREALGSSGD
ncbi:alanine dehydrogenase [Rubritalea marina]|uniref:alanine dehydrogenase n=1 Tax=Rubritalea marina TaxID=361055 RepID=UPI0003761517|nr:alanine dehydrogenase [Rubritalea marina]